MSIKFHSSVLFVKNIEVSKHFYCSILNQEIETDFGNNISFKGGLSLWQIPEWHSLNKDFYKKETSNTSLELCFETENINQIIDLANDYTIDKYQDITEELWGQKTIRVYDPDMNLIEIGESLKTFIKRMYDEGLTIEQINKKSGVPINLISDYIK
ncbi:MAG: hypothetical protein JEY96_04155 [Bacteroidales bacterium]|nr:hypothetical protein [Bacteroidales bacterium]